ncbi:MAG: hypothetical protein V4484_18055 [Pseudomonadota bacterium]
MSGRIAFLTQSIIPAESFLLEHPLAALFTGVLFEKDDVPLRGLTLPDIGEAPLLLTPAQVGRLFMAPDESVVTFRHLGEHEDGTPAGFSVSSDSPFMQEGQPLEIVVYQAPNGNAMRLNNLRVRRVMLNHAAPDRFCTVAFGLMAVNAYRFNFREITLFAAGRAPLNGRDADEYTGFAIWPKFGFDAPLLPVDLQKAPALQNCRSVQDVMKADPAWWEAHGSAREMTFDLRPNSRSWRILLNYLFNVLEDWCHD